jgi:hypothetical protein
MLLLNSWYLKKWLKCPEILVIQHLTIETCHSFTQNVVTNFSLNHASLISGELVTVEYFDG